MFSKVLTFYIVILIFTLCILNLFIFPVYAQVSSIAPAKITLASPLYFLKSAKEIFEMKFAKNPEAKTAKELEFAENRLKEAASLSKGSRQELIAPTLERYWSHMQQFSNRIQLADELTSQKVTQAVVSHMGSLQESYLQASDLKAKRALRLTVFRLSGMQQKMVDKLNSFNKYPLAQQITISKQTACLLLEQEASSSGLNDIEKTLFKERAQKCRLQNL